MMNMRPAAKAQKSRTARPEGTEEMTVTIEYEAEERLEVPYEEIIRNVVEEALDYVECPYDAEVNVVLTDNEGIHQINLDMRGIDRIFHTVRHIIHCIVHHSIAVPRCCYWLPK